MIRDNDVISPYQIAMITIMTIVGVGIFSLPSQLAKTAGTDAWFIIIIGGIINMIALYIILVLANRFPGRTFSEFTGEIIGKVPAILLNLIYAAYFAIFIAYEARLLNEVVKVFLLFRTPSEVIIISLILVCTYAVRGGVECIGRVMELFFPVLFIPLFFILLPGMAGFKMTNMLPVFQDIPSKILLSIPIMSLSFAGYEVLLFYIGFMDKPNKSYLSAPIAMAFITLSYVVITVLCFSVYGENLIKELQWPLLGYVRSINLPGLFIERLDGVMLGIWVFTVFTTMISFYFALTYSLSKIFGASEQKQFVLPMVPLIYYIALIPDNVAQINRYATYVFQYFGRILIFIVPLMLLIIAKLRKKGGIKA
ncbi:GerAB/ArcD/ProY family transporter [Lutispora saccharofermentans]|uniref:Spore germination protein n=1 Tax=Lutispora saccharofermentans TaxID=3024236 RepID=A0ABT1NGV1_9FIRM|nr:endospore germination permease [Lutispora saccharofermentans]MCQ1529081.1 spore germination protein [Lutispora saccharofermentans]